MPLAFEPNTGRTDSEAKFLARGIGYALFLAPTEAVLKLREDSGPSGVLRLQLVGANPSSAWYGSDELAGKSNYILGNSPANWHTNIPNYGKVTERGVYHGIDLVYYGNQHALEYDFVVAPGAKPDAIRLAFEGGKNLHIDQGNLVMTFAGGEVRMHQPVAYQESRGERRQVAAKYVINGGDNVSFQIAEYNQQQPLIIDPTLAYSSYLGGSNIDGANAIAVASDSTAFITGGTFSTDFPTAHPLQPNHGGADDFSRDAFVAKISADGSTLLYSTYLGGKNEDVGNGIAVDTFGDAYVTGTTLSPDFPVTPGAFNTLCGGDGQCGATFNPNKLIVSNAFVSKLNPAGSGLIYSGFLGEYENVEGLAIAVDANQNAYVTGQTEANGTVTVPLTPPETPPPPFPITTSALQGAFSGGAVDAYVTKISTSGSTILYSTYLGGTNEDTGSGITVDANATAYVTGLTYSANFPTVGAIPQAVSGGAGDAFVAKINTLAAGAGSLVYSTYLGGSGLDQGNGIAVDSTGAAYIAGETSSASFVFTPNGFQTTNHGQGDAFVAKLTPTGGLGYFTFLGGSLADTASGVAVDSTFNAYVTGSTVSPDFPVTTPVFQHAYGGGNADAFVAKLGPTGTTLIYSSFLGGTNTEIAGGIAVDSAGSAYVDGQTCSQDFPLSNPFQDASGGNCDAYISKVSVLGGLAINPAGLVFPAQSLNTTSGQQTITLTNTNDAASITISSVTGSGANTADFTETNSCTAAALPAGGQCFITVTFQPSGNGVRKASLSIADNAPGSPQLVSLNGSTSTVSLSSSSLSFETTQVGAASNPQTVMVTNNGSAALNISSVAASGDFAETNTCSVPLQPLTKCSINVTYHPLAAGNSIGAITLTDNGSGSPQVVLLTGTGFVQNPDFAVSAPQPTAETPAGQPVTVPITVSALSGFSGTVSLSCSGLPRGATCAFSPNPVTPAGTVPTTVSLTVGTALRTLGIPVTKKVDPFPTVRPISQPGVMLLLLVSLVVMLMIVTATGGRRRPATAVLGFALILAAFAVACGSGVPAGTPAGTYPITVTGTSGAVTHTTTLTLQVK